MPETGTLQTIEFTWVNARGKTLYLNYVLVPECDQSGKVVGILAVGRDVTERKRIEEALRKSEELYRSIINASPDPIAITDLEGRIIIVSPLALTMFGYAREQQLLGGRSPISSSPMIGIVPCPMSPSCSRT